MLQGRTREESIEGGREGGRERGGGGRTFFWSSSEVPMDTATKGRMCEWALPHSTH